MGQYHVPPLEELVEKFESLPGIGHKSAQRLAYHVLGMTQRRPKALPRPFWTPTRKSTPARSAAT